MSWPSIWQSQNQPPANASQVPMNAGMYAQLTPEQQYLMQQQNWQQWQMFQQQYAQWHAQYGEQYQNKMLGMQAGVVGAAFGQAVLPPPLPTDNNPPPPPPPDATISTNVQQMSGMQHIQPGIASLQQPSLAATLQQPILTAANLQQSSSTANNQQSQSIAPQIPSSSNAEPETSDRSSNPFINRNQSFDSSNNSRESNFDRFAENRRNFNDRNTRPWSQKTRFNRSESGSDSGRNDQQFSNRSSGNSANNYHNRDERSEPKDSSTEMSAEEIQFEQQYRQWDENFMEWKRDSANHSDQQRYDSFVKQMEDMRVVLLQKRETLRQKRVERNTPYDRMAQDDNVQRFSEENAFTDYDDRRSARHSDERTQSSYANESPFFNRASDGGSGIPGLDLVPDSDEKMKEKSESNKSNSAQLAQTSTIPANVSAILENPEIRNILSNLQMQKNKAEFNAGNEPPMHGGGVSRQSGSDFSSQVPLAAAFGPNQSQQPPNRFSGPKPFAPNKQDFPPLQQQHGAKHEQSARQDQLTYGARRDQSPYGSRQEQPPYSQQQQNNYYDGGRRNSDNRFSDDTNNKPHDSGPLNPFANKSTANAAKPDFDEFRPVRVIDYQNRSQPEQNRPQAEQNRPQAEQNRPQAEQNRSQPEQNRSQPEQNRSQPEQNLSQPEQNRSQNDQNRPQPDQNPQIASNRAPLQQRVTNNVVNDDFPRKFYDYNHKPTKHQFRWFSPIHCYEYAHESRRISLHEEPPPSAEELEPFYSRREYRQTREIPYGAPPYHPSFRQERFGAPPFQRFDGPQYRQRAPLYPPRSEFHQGPRHPMRGPNPSHYHGAPPQENSWMRNNRFPSPQPPSNYQDYNRYGADGKPPVDSKSSFRYSDSKPLIKTGAPSVSQIEHSTTPKVVEKREVPKLNIRSLLSEPGRQIRPKNIVVIMRGAPGSGKSFISRMIKDKEHEMGGSARILSIDDYFMNDDDTSGLPAYEYEAEMEERYMQSLVKTFKKTLADALFQFIIVDCYNIRLTHLVELHASSKQFNYYPYICEMPLDVDLCLRQNTHKRSESDIRKAISQWVPTPPIYTVLTYDSLFENEMEDISDDEKANSLDALTDEDNGANVAPVNEISSDEGEATIFIPDEDDEQEDEEEFNEFGISKSKWDNDSAGDKLARLDGTNKPMKHTTFEDYLQMDGWDPPPTSSNGKKRVRWADIEEKREQDKQRAIGFVVGQTNWNNLIDKPSNERDTKNALTQIKYIEKINKNLKDF